MKVGISALDFVSISPDESSQYVEGFIEIYVFIDNVGVNFVKVFFLLFMVFFYFDNFIMVVFDLKTDSFNLLHRQLLVLNLIFQR